MLSVIRVNQNICSILVGASFRGLYSMINEVKAVVSTQCGHIGFVGALTCCTLLYLVCHFKSSEMKMQRSPSRDPIFYKFELGLNTAEATKTFLVLKVDRRTIKVWFMVVC